MRAIKRLGGIKLDPETRAVSCLLTETPDVAWVAAIEDNAVSVFHFRRFEVSEGILTAVPHGYVAEHAETLTAMIDVRIWWANRTTARRDENTLPEKQ